MRTEPNAKINQTSGVVPKIAPKAKWRIKEVRSCQDFKLWVVFNDGTQGEVELSEFLQSSHAGVFSALQDEKLFSQVRLEWGALTWPGGLDLAPDFLYREIKRGGKCILR
ncbi:MAG: DUF2442 domain-containing protein [Leptospirales bacterium]